MAPGGEGFDDDADRCFTRAWLRAKARLRAQCTYVHKDGSIRPWLYGLGEQSDSVRTGCILCAKK